MSRQNQGSFHSILSRKNVFKRHIYFVYGNKIFFNRAFVLSNLVLTKLSPGQNMSGTQSSGFSGATGDFATNKTCSNVNIILYQNI